MGESRAPLDYLPDICRNNTAYEHVIDRRQFLRIAGGTLAAVSLGACAPTESGESQSDWDADPIQSPLPNVTQDGTLPDSPEITLDQMTTEQVADRLRSAVAAGIGYYFIPHPDDEVATQALRHCADELGGPRYTVMSLLTQGDQSYHCDTHGGRGSGTCKADRLQSWFEYLDRDGYGPWEKIQSKAQGGKFAHDVYRGERSALLVYDLGDQRLTREGATMAVDIARDFGESLDIGGPELLVSSGFMYRYDNPASLTAVNKRRPAHPDHQAVYEAIKKYRTAIGAGRAAVCGPVYPGSNTSMEVTNIVQVVDSINTAYGWLSSNGQTWSERGLYSLTGLTPAGRQSLEVFELPRDIV